MTPAKIYLPRYANSWALIIGINKYDHASPLLHACNDAEAIANVLTDQFSFPAANVDILLNKDATRDKIIKAFLKYADDTTIEDDDRILVFFAGHGHTASGRRGEVGFLVPVDGDSDDLSSLIRWDELTRNADLIPAKHMLFLMDACYGVAYTYSKVGSDPNSQQTPHFGFFDGDGDFIFDTSVLRKLVPKPAPKPSWFAAVWSKWWWVERTFVTRTPNASTRFTTGSDSGASMTAASPLSSHAITWL